MSIRRPTTILGNAAKWAVLMPFAVVAIAVCIGVAFCAGWGFASLLTDRDTIKAIAGAVSIAMGLGAWMGAVNA